MAEVATSGQHRPSQSISNLLSTTTTSGIAPQIEMSPDPEISFPRLPPFARGAGQVGLHLPRERPISARAGGHRPQTADAGHTKATSMLPSFSFNAVDHSGLQAGQSSTGSGEFTALTPSRGHRRNVSEFVGGVGMTSAISSSPTRTSAIAVPNPRRHVHRRSAAVSSHDLSGMMAAAEPQRRLSSSLPSTPLEHPMDMSNAFSDYSALPAAAGPADSFGPSLDAAVISRPPSRRQVGFSENVEYIPRPLSTISSETEGSLSTVRGHSVNNSISSVLSLSSPSPPTARSRAISLETTLEDEPKFVPRSSLDLNKRVEREREWLKHNASGATLERSKTESTTNPKTLTFAPEDVSAKPRIRAGRKHSSSRSLGFDRRRSEPAIGMHASEQPRRSAFSLQPSTLEQRISLYDDEAPADRRSSRRKIKDWAVSKIARRARPRSEIFAPCQPLTSEFPGSVAETNLDAVFSIESDVDAVQERTVIPQPQGNTHIPLYSQQSGSNHRDSDDGPMLDLDDALGSSRAPTQSGSQKPRKILHSDRGTSDFVGPGLHYQPPLHQRTLSAPVLMAFDHFRTSTPPQQPMEVFDEEDEEQVKDAQGLRLSSTAVATDDDGGVGISVVETDENLTEPVSETSLDEGLRIYRPEWDLERPSTSYSLMGSRLSTPGIERRASSIIDQTIVEESSPVNSVAIVNDLERWQESVDIRAHSLTKSSDSSEAPTVLAVPTGLLSLPENLQSLDRTESYHSSAFPSPDFVRHKGSFDTGRVGTSASSMMDNRTMSSCTTGEHQHDRRVSVDDVPSLTSSRSTMISTLHANSSRRDISGVRTPSVTSGFLDSTAATERRRKRASIQSLSQLVGSSFGSRTNEADDTRPSTAATETVLSQIPKKKEHRLKKLMFWKSKHRQASTSTLHE